jgi:hypothetical protein
MMVEWHSTKLLRFIIALELSKKVWSLEIARAHTCNTDDDRPELVLEIHVPIYIGDLQENCRGRALAAFQ